MTELTGGPGIGPIRVLRPEGERALVLCARVADRWWERMIGLLGQRSLAPGAGLLIVPSNGIHTCGMRFPIDAVFVDGRGRVIRCVRQLRPWRFVPYVRGAVGVLELASGAVDAAQLVAGDELSIGGMPLLLAPSARLSWTLGLLLGIWITVVIGMLGMGPRTLLATCSGWIGLVALIREPRQVGIPLLAGFVALALALSRQ